LGKASKKEGPERTQYAALPYRVGGDGRIEVLLATSRETKRWVIPKGWPMKGIKPHKAAAREAFEETGAVGRAAKIAIGRYEYWKRLKESFVLCRVKVFPLRVERLEETWSEQGERQRRWFSQAEAAARVEEPGLRTLIAGFAPAPEPKK
jgi:8-oxo-dGTP pyrophosphatase MutT (NUDIX family)